MAWTARVVTGATLSRSTRKGTNTACAVCGSKSQAQTFRARLTNVNIVTLLEADFVCGSTLQQLQCEVAVLSEASNRKRNNTIESILWAALEPLCAVCGSSWQQLQSGSADLRTASKKEQNNSSCDPPGRAPALLLLSAAVHRSNCNTKAYC